MVQKDTELCFEVALSVPGGRVYIFQGGALGDSVRTDRPTERHVATDSVESNEWLHRKFAVCDWSGWYMYNDDPPNNGKFQYVSDGHCKGIVLWNETRVGWLVHTVSGWPTEMPIEQLPDDASTEGHSFAFWTGPRSILPKVEQQIDLMGGRVYAGKRSQITRRLHIGTLQRVKLDDQTDHVAKNKLWGRDVYQSLGKCSVQSRASLDDTSLVQNVIRIALPGWDASVDFGRWAVGDTWVAVGDIRRGHSDFEVGGGALIRYDVSLARQLRGIIMS